MELWELGNSPPVTASSPPVQLAAASQTAIPTQQPREFRLVDTGSGSSDLLDEVRSGHGAAR